MRTTRLRCRSAVALAIALGAANTAKVAAQAVPDAPTSDAMEVSVVASPCEGVAYDPEQVWQLVRVELASLGVDAKRATPDAVAAAQAQPSAAVIAIECSATPETLALRIYDMVGARELRREVTLTDIAEPSRPRAVALAAVGLLESSWLGLVADATPERSALSESVHNALRERLVRRLEVSATEAAPPEPEPPEPPLFALGATLRAFPSRSTGLIGLAFTLFPSIGERERIALYTEALWSHGELSKNGDSVGRMNLYWLTAGVGVGWRVGDAPEIEMGPRLLAGYAVANASASAEDEGAQDRHGWVGAALLVATVRWRASDALHVMLEADLGYAPIGVSFVGDGSRVSGMTDTTTSLRLGVAW